MNTTTAKGNIIRAVDTFSIDHRSIIPSHPCLASVEMSEEKLRMNQ